MIGRQALHCAGVLLRLVPAATQLSDDETALLQDLASQASSVAEIGVFEGVTTRRMIERMPSGSTIYGLDPFFPGRLGVSYGYWITRAEIRRAARKDVQCILLRRLSYDVAPDFNVSLDLVFIDADHSYDAVRRDWDDWSVKIVPGGYIALHDSQPVPGRCRETVGPVRLVRELGDRPSGFELAFVVDSLTAYRRV